MNDKRAHARAWLAKAESASLPMKLQLTARQVSRLWRHVATIENFWESLAEKEPASA